MSNTQTQKNHEKPVDSLHLKYLEASFEGFRRSAFYLTLINAGAILALIGLFPVFVSAGADLKTVAPLMKSPLLLLLFGLIVSILSLTMFSLSQHEAAWGKPKRERRFRIMGQALLSVAIILFCIGAFLAISIISDPASFIKIVQPIYKLTTY